MNFPIPKSNDLTSQKYYIAKYGSIEKLIDKAKNGEIHAQADLGWAYSEGFGDLLPQDDDKAIGWLSTAIDKGYELPHTLGKLGELLQGCHGQGKVREKQKFFKVREKSGNFAKSQGKSQFLSKSVKSQGILFSGWRKVL